MKTLILLSVILIAAELTAQWGISGSYNIRNEQPFNGIGVQLQNKLPFQFPDYGIKIRAGFDYDGIDKEQIYNSLSYNFSAIASFFLRHFYPYAGLSAGADYFTAALTQDEQYIKWNYFISLLGGLEKNILKYFSLFVEAGVYQFLSSFDYPLRDISSTQIKGRAGIIITF